MSSSSFSCYTSHMTHIPKRILFLFIGTASLILLLLTVIFLPPSQPISLVLFSLPPISIAFVLFFISCYSLLTLITKHSVHGLLFAIFGTSYLLLRLFHFTNLLYTILLLALFATLEFALSSKK